MNDDCSLANKGHDTRPSGLSRSSQHPAHGALHRAIVRAVQGVLAGIMTELTTYRTAGTGRLV
jgi:hypothetical protein